MKAQRVEHARVCELVKTARDALYRAIRSPASQRELHIITAFGILDLLQRELQNMEGAQGCQQ